MTTTRFGIFLTVMVLCTSPTNAALWLFDPIVLDGLQETPPVATPGTGTGTALLDDVSGILSVSGSFSSLIGTTNNAHIHGYQPPGTPAGVVFGLTFDFGVTSGDFSGSGAVNVANTLAGLTYVNIHTTFRPGGEIRGQLLNPERVPEPASIALLSIGAIAVFGLRRRLCRAV